MLSLICFLLLVGSAIFLPVFFLKRHPGSKEPKKALIWVPILFGLLALIVGAILNEIFIPLDPTSPEKIVLPLYITFVAAMGVGLIEEACKFWPAAFFLHKKSYFDQYTDGMIYFGFIGLFFGLLEHIMYLLTLGPAVGFMRLALAVYFHAALTGILGFYFADNNIKGKPMRAMIVPFLIMAGIHGLYDFCLLSESILILAGIPIAIALNIELFVYYKKAIKLDTARLAHTPIHTPVVVTGSTTSGQPQSIVSATAPSNFCPHCGKQNVNQAAFCIYCGAKL